jgi:VWFA-related protein
VVVAGQSPQQQPQTPVFRGGVDLVALDVRVVDKDGAPVPGLTAEDFTVTLADVARPVRALDYITFGRATRPDLAVEGSTDAAASTASTDATNRPGRVILFVVDDVSARPLEIVALTTAAEKMLPTFAPTDLVGLVTTSGLGAFVPPTTDHLAVRAALSNRDIVGRADMRNVTPFVTIQEGIEITRAFNDAIFEAAVDRECGPPPINSSALAISSRELCKTRVRASARMVDTIITNQRDQQLQGYAHAIAALKAEPVPRVLIALTKGFALSPYVPAPLEAISRAAASADVTFYALVPGGDTGIDLSDRSPSAHLRERARVEDAQFLVDGTHSLASAAGGEAFNVIGQPDRFLRRIDIETSALYRLGIEVPRGDPNQTLDLKIAVNKPGVTVRTNIRAIRRLANASSASDAPPDPMRLRLLEGGTSAAVPMHAAVSARRDPDGTHAQLLLAVDVPASTPGPLKALFAVIDGTGTVVQSGRADVPASANDDYHLTVPVPMDEGDYRVRVVMSDANGALGSVDQPADVHLQHLGSVTTSDLLISTSVGTTAPHLLTSETLPPSATMIQAGLELYPSEAAMPALRVHFSVTPAAGGAPIADVDVVPTLRNNALVVSSSMSADALKVGAYTFTATVTSAGQALGQVRATIRKAQ